ncbi:hypothetical protein DFP72DRAFT_1051061 [Ephemerocybe angulata]|uniref:Uncharacterized protein n=1 Tax=Ephemerocybe angulata TaxID=980116 RepID=A0A8H6LVU7_9AGAR|nr:hypothetical protein DFP72DRAFT_1051061 [Tulosesus angulatus]
MKDGGDGWMDIASELSHLRVDVYKPYAAMDWNKDERATIPERFVIRSMMKLKRCRFLVGSHHDVLIPRAPSPSVSPSIAPYYALQTYVELPRRPRLVHPTTTPLDPSAPPHLQRSPLLPEFDSFSAHLHRSSSAILGATSSLCSSQPESPFRHTPDPMRLAVGPAPSTGVAGPLRTYRMLPLIPYSYFFTSTPALKSTLSSLITA